MERYPRAQTSLLRGGAGRTSPNSLARSAPGASISTRVGPPTRARSSPSRGPYRLHERLTLHARVGLLDEIRPRVTRSNAAVRADLERNLTTLRDEPDASPRKPSKARAGRCTSRGAIVSDS